MGVDLDTSMPMYVLVALFAHLLLVPVVLDSASLVIKTRGRNRPVSHSQPAELVLYYRRKPTKKTTGLTSTHDVVAILAGRCNIKKKALWSCVMV